MISRFAHKAVSPVRLAWNLYYLSWLYRVSSIVPYQRALSPGDIAGGRSRTLPQLPPIYPTSMIRAG